MADIIIHTDSKEYPVFVHRNAIDMLPSFLHNALPGLTNILIITDYNVGKRYLPELVKTLAEFHPLHFVVPNGDAAKTFEVYQNCITKCLVEKLDRKSCILAFGGGAVGDLAGFVAATFMRGIPFIGIPTTILAHDSAVGGKVAINHKLGKNLVGAFHQPEAVFYDLRFLNSLPVQEKRSGFAEVIKHGLIHDPVFLNWLMENINDLNHINDEQMSYMLEKGIAIKGEIVAQDEKEKGIRAFLNFGHTFGHAVEAEGGYGWITHGEAVIIGMNFALQVSKEIHTLPFDMSQYHAWLTKLGYKMDYPAQLDIHKLLARMKGDKKSVGGNIGFVLLKEIGNPVIHALSDEFVLSELEKFREGVN